MTSCRAALRISGLGIAAAMLVVVFFAINADAALSEAEMHDLFSQGKALFKQANSKVSTDPEAGKKLYERAALRFERLAAEGGIQSGKLYYNIGNAYFRMGDLGRAILNYRRAERYIPNDPNLNQNLRYAHSRRIDKIEETQQAKVFKTLLFWHYDFPPNIRAMVFALCYGLFWFAALIHLFVRKIPRWVFVGPAFIGLLFFGSVCYETISHISSPGGVILSEAVIARKGDGITYQPSFKEPLHEGTEFTMIEKRGGWYQIELSDGRRCWIPETSAELI